MFDMQFQFLKNPPLSTRKSLTVVDKGGARDVVGEFKPFEMGMQVSCGVYPERAEERVVWEDTEDFGASVSRIGTAEEEPDRNWAYAGGSCAYADQYTPTVCGGRGDRVSQRQECDSNSAAVWRAEAEFQW